MEEKIGVNGRKTGRQTGGGGFKVFFLGVNLDNSLFGNRKDKGFLFVFF